MAELMTEIDWVTMLDTALMHSAMWGRGRWEFAAEVRLRLAAFGATPADRMRLRVVWADADRRDRDVPQMAPVPASRERYSGLSVVADPIRPALEHSDEGGETPDEDEQGEPA